LSGNITFANDGHGIIWGTTYSKLYDNGSLHFYTDDSTYFDSAGTGAVASWVWTAGASSSASGSTWMALTNQILTVTGQINATNEITAYSSDKRLKTDIRPITNAVDKITALNGVIYKWNDIAGKYGFDQTIDVVGLFAQEVEAVLPEAVKPAPFDNDGEGGSKSGEHYKTIQYEKLVPLLVESIKELEKRIRILENKE